MRIEFSKNFIKKYNRRIRSNFKLVRKVDTRIQMFLQNWSNPILRDHALTGERNNERSFSITGDIRIIYVELEEYFLFLDVGTHSQVY